MYGGRWQKVLYTALAEFHFASKSVGAELAARAASESQFLEECPSTRPRLMISSSRQQYSIWTWTLLCRWPRWAILHQQVQRERSIPCLHKCPNSDVFSRVLCYNCGAPLIGSTLCNDCIKLTVDISQGVQREAVLNFCRDCERWLLPPAT